MSQLETWHVTPREDGWQVKKENADRASSRHESKNDAVRAAKSIAKNKPRGQVKVHKTDGTIHQEFTFDGTDGAS